MDTQSQIQSNLNLLGFKNPSISALYNKIAQSVGIVVDNTITEINNTENNILSIINTQRYGKSGYYTRVAKAFQYGDNLVIDPVTFDFIYAVIDPTKQIVAQAAFAEINSGSNSQLYLKIAKLNTLSGLLEPLTTPELDAFKNYYVNFEIPGLPVTIVSNPANIFSFNALATYYATYDFTTLQTNLAAALINFRNSFAFNGELFSGDLQDYIKANVPGMRDFYINNTLIDSLPFSGSQSLTAGYFDYVTGYLSNITYTAI